MNVKDDVPHKKRLRNCRGRDTSLLVATSGSYHKVDKQDLANFASLSLLVSKFVLVTA